jgi:hypothetical protein
MERGDYEHSLPVFMATLSTIGTSDRPNVLGSLSRAAAGAGDIGAFEWAKRQIEDCGVGPGVAEAWVDLARAAMTLSRDEEAWESAQIAESIARQRREGQMRFLAESIMNDIQAERRADAEREPTELIPDPAISDQLARRLIRTLQLAPSVPGAP